MSRSADASACWRGASAGVCAECGLYDSAAFRDLVVRYGTSSHARERQRLFADMQRHLAVNAVNAWISAPQVSTVARKGLRGLWMNYPISVHDISALSWD